MRANPPLLVIALFAAAQAQQNPTTAWTPPRMLVLVHQEFPVGKAAQRRQLAISSARAFDRLDVPVHFVQLEGVTGPGDSLSLDPFDSYAEIEKAITTLNQLYAAHQDIARIQQSINELLVSSKTVTAILRDDLSPRASEADESQARFMRVTVIHVHPGHEAEFAAPSAPQSPSLVYQVDFGTSQPAFIVLTPMQTLKEADGVLTTDPASKSTRSSFASMESNLYTINPEMSHVAREFAARDPDFWSPPPGGKTRGASRHTQKSAHTKP